jgi:nitrogen fixation/metabolism regulation signal transduction histidine kinase
VTVAWITLGRIARRLKAIALAADRIREGDILTVMPGAKGEGEMAHLCGAHGQMVSSLREQQANLEAENARLAARPRGPEV